MNEKINEALEQISDKHLEEAANYHNRSRRTGWLSAIAAVLAVVIAWGAIWKQLQNPGPDTPVLQFAEPTTTTLLRPTAPSTQDTGPTTVTIPLVPTAPSENTDPKPTAPLMPPQIHKLVAEPVYPKLYLSPNYADYSDYNQYYADLAEWNKHQRELYDQPQGYADSLDRFFETSIPEFLSGEGNRTYSPLNVYLAMAMLAQTTGGNSRQQILDLFGVDSIEALQEQAGHVWKAHYRGDGQCTTLLANSLWLDNYFPYKEATVQTLAQHYYASVFHSDLGTEESDQLLRHWLNSQTGGLLEEQAIDLSLDPTTVFALASTCHFTAGWGSEFSTDKTADSIFHCKDMDLTTPFMNTTFTAGIYYWGTDFGAVRLALNGGNAMWLILPDEGKTVEDVLQSNEYWEMTQNRWTWENQKELKIHLSLPKFDVSSQSDLIEGMMNLGITDVFGKNADFSPISDMDSIYVGQIDHAARVAIDEEGVIAASYTVIDMPVEGIPQFPEEEIDFTLDRPFLFLVTSQDNLPLFTGVVEQP